jgi:hypothetical protein
VASPFQQRSLQRKIIYIVLILVFFTATLVLRRNSFVIPLPFDRQINFVCIDDQAKELEIREENLGEVELTGSAVRLMLTGSRGFAVCALWWSANEKRRKHEWNELELLVNSVTKLQPHFITPWMFQSWDLAYNVSVEADWARDQYFYISEGIGLLANGEKQNRNNPDMRYMLGIYNQNKIGISDQTNTYRCLYQMSCIDPVERDPERMRKPAWFSGSQEYLDGLKSDGVPDSIISKLTPLSGKDFETKEAFQDELLRHLSTDEISEYRTRLVNRAQAPEAKRNLVLDRAKFKRFTVDHPMLVRRLRELLNRESPEQVLEFLSENQKIPSMYDREAPPQPGMEPHSDLKPLDKRFPVLSPVDANDTAPWGAADPTSIGFDNFQVARDWFIYAQKPLPPPDPVQSVLNPNVYDPRKYRLPRFTVHIFRSYPARAQTYNAEHLEREGWFDRDGWGITGWFADEKLPNEDDAVISTSMVSAAAAPSAKAALPATMSAIEAIAALHATLTLESMEKPTFAGKDVAWGENAWSRAFEMYKAYGTRTGLYLEPEEENNLEIEAADFRKRYGITRDYAWTAGLTDEIREMGLERGYLAHVRLFGCDKYRRLTNFFYFYFKTMIEAEKTTIDMRKTLFEAERLRKTGDREQALAKFISALPILRQILLSEKGLRLQQLIQEDSYAIALQARQLFIEIYGNRVRELSVLADYLAQATIRPGLGVRWCPNVMGARDFYLDILTPLDGDDTDPAAVEVWTAMAFQGDPLICFVSLGGLTDLAARQTPIVDTLTKNLARTRLGLPSPPASPERQLAAPETPRQRITTEDF